MPGRSLWYSWLRRRGRRRTPASPVAGVSAEDLLAAVPAELRDQLPDLDPAILLAAYSLAHHGASADRLVHQLSLTVDQALAVLSHTHPTGRG
jgi:DNA-directed RNA polymerase specialized sigma24 family protein